MKEIFKYFASKYQEDSELPVIFFVPLYFLVIECALLLRLPVGLPIFYHGINLLGMLLIISRSWAARHFPQPAFIVWQMLLFCTLPLAATLILFAGKFAANYWLLYMIAALVFLMLTDWQRMLVMFVGGFIGVGIFYHEVIFALSSERIWLGVGVWIAVFLGVGYCHQRKTKYLKQFSQMQLHEEKLVVLNNIAASIAHELRTPLSTVNLGLHNLRACIAQLLQIYDIARASNLLLPPVQPQMADLIATTLTRAEAEIQASFTFINMLLVNVNEKSIAVSRHEVCRVSACINEALQRYPFTGKERAMVSCDLTNDFEFMGNHVLLVHVLFNLLKNALYYVRKKTNARITIILEYGKSKNILRFRDSGGGLPKKEQRRVFEKFYSHTKFGAGIGLAFCQNVMQSFGGEIECRAKEWEYTEFVLYFPSNLERNGQETIWQRLLRKDPSMLKTHPGI